MITFLLGRISTMDEFMISSGKCPWIIYYDQGTFINMMWRRKFPCNFNTVL